MLIEVGIRPIGNVNGNDFDTERRQQRHLGAKGGICFSAEPWIVEMSRSDLPPHCAHARTIANLMLENQRPPYIEFGVVESESEDVDIVAKKNVQPAKGIIA